MQQLLPRATFNRRYVVPPWRSMSGFGDAATYVQQGGAIATPVVTGVVASQAAAMGAGATILGMAPALAIPVIGAAIAGVAIGITLLLRSGCGQSCVITSNWANEAEALLVKNIQAYFSIPAPRTRLQQQAALENVDKVTGYLFQQCSQVSGRPGENCIADRKAGACKWKQTSDSPLLAYPGEPQPGECWNWDSGYRAPIANDPNVTDAPAGTSTTGIFADMGVGTALAQVQSALGGISPILLIGAALLAIGILGGKK